MKDRIFKRKIYSDLLDWKQTWDGKTAVLIQGARRIGKSTVAEEFARREYQSYILIDFSKCSEEVFNLFNDTSDLNYIFVRLQVTYGVNLIPRKSVIILDEVQLQPKARQAIKTLVADHRYDYIETGSLISIRKNVQGIVIPSEEKKLKMYPMDYEEFRWALGDQATIPLLRQFFDNKIPLLQALRKTMRDFRMYMLVGGMPQAVDTYLNTNNLSFVDEAKRAILDLYDEDFMKIDSGGKAAQIYSAIPSQLSGNASRYRLGSVINDARAAEMRELISEMVASMTVNVAYHCYDPNVGLPLNMNIDYYKMFICDTGLFVTLAFRDKKFTDNVIYDKLLSDKLPTNLGYVYENMVAQILTASGYKLFYHSWPTESGKHNYEIDFLLSRGSKIVPIEVKSSGYKTHTSLDAFCKKYSSRVANERYLIYTKDYEKEGAVTYLPVYMTSFL